MDIENELRLHEERTGLPRGMLSAIMQQETGGKQDYIVDPAKYHYGLNAEGKRIAGHTGKVSTAFGPFGILESTAASPGYGVEPLKDKSLGEQLRFASDYLSARIRKAGSVEAGLAGYGEGSKYAAQVLGRLGQPVPAQSETPTSFSTLGQLEETTAKRTALREQATIGNVLKEKFYDPRENALWNFVEREQAPDADPSFSWFSYKDKDKIEAGLNPEELAFVRENATSEQRVNWALGQLQERRRKDELYAEAGTATNLLASFGVGMADPVGWAAGIGVGKAFQMARIGSRVLARSGQTGKAVTSAVGENVIGNVAWELAQDLSGEVKTLEDYGMAAVFGAGFTGLSVPGIVRESYSSRVMEDAMAAARTVEDRAIDARLNDPRPAELRGREQAAEISAIVKDASTVRAADELGEDVAVPRDLLDEIREIEGEAPTRPVEAPEAPGQGVGTSDVEIAAVRAVDTADEAMLSEAVAQEATATMARINELQTEAAALDPDVPEQAARIEQLDREVYELQARIDELPGPSGQGAVVRADQRDAEGKPMTFVPGAKMRVEDVLREGLKSEAASLQANAKNGPEATRDARMVQVMAERLLNVLPPSIKNMMAEFNAATATRLDTGEQGFIERGSYRPLDDTLILPGKDPASLPARDKLTNRQRNLFAVHVHEITHAATAKAILAVQKGLDVPQIVKQSYQRLEELRAELTEQLKKDGTYNPASETGANYATRNPDEFVAQAMSDLETMSVLARMEGRGYAEDNALGRTWRAILGLLGIKRAPLGRAPMTAAEEAGQLIEALIRYGEHLPEGVVWYRPDGIPGYKGPALQGPNNLTATTDRRFAERMYQHAQAWLARNPFDPERMKVLAQQALRKGSAVRDVMVSDGLKMAGSANPVVRMMAGLVVETTTGAAGRRTTAALRKYMLNQSLTGRSVLDYTSAYGDFRRRNGGSIKEDLLNGETKRQFDREVYEEILSRRYLTAPTLDPAVRAGADAMEAMFSRSLQAQKDASTLGSGLLPPDSRGYVPQALDGDKLAMASAAELDELADHLSKHWAGVYGWTPQFSKEFSRVYIDRARRRANGEQGIDWVATESPSAAVRDTLEEMHLQSRSLSARARAELDTVGAQPQNKKRLDVDLMGALPSGKRVIDFYHTDVERLARVHVNRVSGAVALAEFNVLGQRGINNILRTVDLAAPDQRATPEERAALVRSFAQLLGQPVPGEVRSAVATNIAGITRMQRLGGLAFTQLSEMANIVHHLGFASLFRGLSSLPAMVKEVSDLKNGRSISNDWLGSLEKAQGFEFGMEGFTMHARLDPPDELLRQYGKGNDVATRAIAAGNHLQAQLSFFRGLHAAQHRAVAELILKKAIGEIEAMKGNALPSKMLEDMGFTPALIRAIRADLPRAVLRDAQGNAVGFDITQLSTQRAQTDLLAVIHRGTGQIIQRTYVGEAGSWAHNDVLKLLFQLRTFGLTAMEKQWGRTRAVNSGGALNGYGYAAGVLLGQMALAVPVYLARLQLAAAGREDREDFIDKATAPASILAAVMNYTAMSGLGGDAFDMMASLGGGWSDDVKETLGVRSYGGGVGNVVPAFGSIDAAWRVASGKADLYTAFKQLPFSNLPYLVPVINLTKSDE